MTDEKLIEILDVMRSLDNYAIIRTTDPKVYVGCSLGTENEDGKYLEVCRGVNCNYSFNERIRGKTYRQMMFNSTDTKYRPWDKITHAEENAIYNALSMKKQIPYDTAIVTRYPCEKCAQLLIFKGIKKVYYGRSTEISKETAKMFADAGVTVVHITDYEVDESDGPRELQFKLGEHIDFVNSLKKECFEV